MRRTGYTIIEIVIVMLVMGIMAAVAAPRYIEATARFRVEAAARRIVADLDYVRARAMMKGSVVEEWVGFYPASEEYEINAAPDLDHPDQEYWVNFAKTAYPVDMVSAQFTNTEGFTSNDIVKFDMYGFSRVGSSPSAPLTSGQIILSSGNETRTIIIDPVTGRASIQ